MKKVFILSAVIAASLIATKSYSQVYVNAHVGFRVPGARVYVSSGPAYYAPAPPVVYQQAPVYAAPAPAPVYNDEYAPAPDQCDRGGYEAEFPGYVYYNYPVWEGHYRDRWYYAHYRPYFEREHYEYFNHGRFDRDRYEHDRYDHDRWEHRDHDGDHDHGRGHAWGRRW